MKIKYYFLNHLSKFINAAPQFACLNKNDWRSLEEKLRKFVAAFPVNEIEQQDLYIITGEISYYDRFGVNYRLIFEKTICKKVLNPDGFHYFYPNCLWRDGLFIFFWTFFYFMFNCKIPVYSILKLLFRLFCLIYFIIIFIY